MKIGILGAGAMGSLYGGYLASTDNDIYLIDINEKHIDKINSDGLRIERDGKHQVIKEIKATNKPESIGLVDILIIFVKSTQTLKALESARSVIGQDTVLMTLQNGTGNIESIGSLFESNQIVAGTTSNGATLIDNGVVYHAGIGITTIGDSRGNNNQMVDRIRDLLCSVGIETAITNNPVGLIWDKLMVNVGINAITAITGMKNGMIIEHKESEEILELAVREAMDVATELGIELNTKDPISYTKKVCSLTANNISSMLQDVLAGKETEIDYINGAIVRKGEELSINTPINLMLTNLVKLKNK